MKTEAIRNVPGCAFVSEKVRKDAGGRGAGISAYEVDDPRMNRSGPSGEEAEKSMICDTGLSGVEVEKRFRSAAKTMIRSEAAAAFYLAEIDDRRLWRELGYSSVTAYAAAASDISVKKAYALLNIGRRIRELPVIRTAFDEGRIGWTKVRDILRIKEVFDETEVLEIALTSSSRDLERFVAKKNETENRLKRAAVSSRDRDRNQVEIFGNEGAVIPESFEKTGPDNPLTGPDNSAAGPDNSAAGPDNSDSGNAPPPDAVSKKTESGGRSRTAPAETAAVTAHLFVNVTLKLTPEELAIFNEGHRVWKRKNPGEWKRERMVVSLIRSHFEKEARASLCGKFPRETDASSDSELSEPQRVVEKRNSGAAPVIIDSPYNIYIHHCPECGKNSLTGKQGDFIEAGDSIIGKALCDGAAHEIDRRGVPGRKKRSVSPALRKKIFMRDGGVCRVPGCGKTSSLEVHHVRPLSTGGGNSPANLLLCCSLCRYRHNLHYADFRVMPTWNTSSILISCMA